MPINDEQDDDEDGGFNALVADGGPKGSWNVQLFDICGCTAVMNVCTQCAEGNITPTNLCGGSLSIMSGKWTLRSTIP